MQKPSILAIAGIASLAVLIGLSTWFGMGGPESVDGPESRSVQRGNVEMAGELVQAAGGDPAVALQLGLWPGLPHPAADAESGRESNGPVRYTRLEIDDAKNAASSIIEGSYADMVATVDELSGAVKAEIAVKIGDRLFECWDYSERSLDELEEAGAQAFENKLQLDEIFAAQMAPGVAEQAVRQMAMLDRDQWIADWIARQLAERATKEARCGGVETVPREERMGVAFDWWERAAALGSLEAKAQWIGMAFINAKPYFAGNAVEIAELKPRVIDAIHELLRKRYAPILLQLMMFDRQGIFSQPNPQRAWLYGEALRRIVQTGSVGNWQVPDEMNRAELNGVLDALQRLEAELTPAQLREAEAWVRAIVELPAR